MTSNQANLPYTSYTLVYLEPGTNYYAPWGTYVNAGDIPFFFDYMTDLPLTCSATTSTADISVYPTCSTTYTTTSYISNVYSAQSNKCKYSIEICYTGDWWYPNCWTTISLASSYAVLFLDYIVPSSSSVVQTFTLNSNKDGTYFAGVSRLQICNAKCFKKLTVKTARNVLIKNNKRIIVWHKYIVKWSQKIKWTFW